MGFSILNLFRETREIIFTPKEFWEKQRTAFIRPGSMMMQFLFPYLMLIALAVFLGEFLRSHHFYAGFALLKSLREVLLFTLQYFFAVFFTNALMKTFGKKKNRDVARRLVLFSMIPFLLVSVITGLFPFLYVIDVLGMYSFYIFWVGARTLVFFQERKLQKFILSAILVNFFIFSFLSIILRQILTAYM